MIQPRYAYAYAIIRESDGRCYDVQDTSEYHEDRLWIPISPWNGEYLMKYYYPIPTAYGDFNGRWYTDKNHQNEWIPE